MSEFLYKIKIVGEPEEVTEGNMVGVSWREVELEPLMPDPTLLVDGFPVQILIAGLQGFSSLHMDDGRLREVKPHAEKDHEGKPVTEYWGELTAGIAVLRMVGLQTPALAIPIIQECRGRLPHHLLEMDFDLYLAQGPNAPLVIAEEKSDKTQLFISPLRGPSGVSHSSRPVGNGGPQWSFIFKTCPKN